jgi:hypothetical protein
MAWGLHSPGCKSQLKVSQKWITNSSSTYTLHTALTVHPNCHRVRNCCMFHGSTELISNHCTNMSLCLRAQFWCVAPIKRRISTSHSTRAGLKSRSGYQLPGLRFRLPSPVALFKIRSQPLPYIPAFINHFIIRRYIIRTTEGMLNLNRGALFRHSNFILPLSACWSKAS